MNKDHRQSEINDSGRDKGLDVVKGWLVVGMVLIHTASIYLHSGNTGYLFIKSSLSFVNGSWIYITGVIIATYYVEKMTAVNWGKVSYRLLTRGIKLLFIFTSINVILILLGWSQGGLNLSWDSLYAVLIPGAKEASFSILIGISYMLIISPLLLIQRKLGIILALLFLLSLPLLQYYNVRIEVNLWVISFGMGGFLVGRVLKTDWLGKLIRYKRMNALLLLASIIGTALYFNIRLDYGRNIFVYLFGITSILAMLYLSFQWFAKLTTVVNVLDLLGRYPLFGYIWQMAVIIGLDVTLSRLGISIPYIISLLLVMVVLISSIRLLDILVSRNALANKIYILVFG